MTICHAQTLHSYPVAVIFSHKLICVQKDAYSLILPEILLQLAKVLSIAASKAISG